MTYVMVYLFVSMIVTPFIGACINYGMGND
jgi:hypothetical protein